MAAFNKFNQFVEDLGLGIHDFRAANDVLRIYLSNAVPSASLDLVKADLAEIAAGNGYTAGGADIQNDQSETGGTLTVTGVDVTYTASGGSIGPFQYVVLYNDTPAAPLDPLIGWWDYGSAITLLTGESFTTDFGTSIFTIA
mgnify:FL=1